MTFCHQKAILYVLKTSWTYKQKKEDKSLSEFTFIFKYFVVCMNLVDCSVEENIISKLILVYASRFHMRWQNIHRCIIIECRRIWWFFDVLSSRTDTFMLHKFFCFFRRTMKSIPFWRKVHRSGKNTSAFSLKTVVEWNYKYISQRRYC